MAAPGQPAPGSIGAAVNRNIAAGGGVGAPNGNTPAAHPTAVVFPNARTGVDPRNVDPRHVALNNNAGRVASLPGGMTPTQVRSMQQFLVNRGFNVSVDGVMGSQTKSAAQAFRANHAGGASWNMNNGRGPQPTPDRGFRDANLHAPDGAGVGGGPLHPDLRPGRTTAGAGHAGPVGVGAGSTVGGVNTTDAFGKLMAGLLKGGVNIGTGLSPASFGAAAAAPDTALAAALARQVAANPRQEAQNQADISNWYGLNPSASSYQLSVLGRLGEAGARDAAAASAAEGNVGDLAKSLAGSIGGSANDASGQVLAAGADAAGTMGALGQNQQQYANDMNPLIAAEARGEMSKTKAANTQSLLQLQDQLAQAKGAAEAARAQGVAGATQQDNALAQQRFANQGNLLSLLAQYQASNPNSPMSRLTLDKLMSEINYNNARAGYETARATNPGAFMKPSSGSVPKFDPAKGTEDIARSMGLQSTVLPQGFDSQRLAQTIGAYLRSQGLHPGDGRFKQAGDALWRSFFQHNGQPLGTPPASWVI